MKTTAHKRAFEAITWRTRVQALRNIRALLALAWKAGPFLFVLSISLRIVRSALPVTTLWVTKYIIDGVVSIVVKHTGSSSAIWKLVALDAALYLGGDILRRLSVLAESILGDCFIATTNIRMMEHTITLDLERFEDPAFQDRLERARQQGSGRLSLLTSVLGLIQDFLGVIFLSSGLLFAAPWLLVLLFLSIAPAFFGEAKLAAMEYSILFRRTPHRRRLDYLKFLCASLYSVKEVSLFSLGRYLIHRYLSEWQNVFRENKAMALRRAWIGGLLNLIPTAGYYCGYILLVLRTLAGAISVGSFLFLTRAFFRSCTLIERIFSTISEISDESLRLGDLFRLFNVKPALTLSQANLSVPRPIRSGFEFRNVGFKYPGTERWVLRNMNFTLESSHRIALVGANGTGKTTIAKLLARLYDPTEGQILLDGVDLRDYDVADLHNNITAVFQDYVRYDLTVTENIGFGEIGKIDDLPLIRQAAGKSRSDKIIESFPAGYAQMLGRRFEGGVDISGGEWQKLALARASMRTAQLWILDEPTAALDPGAEFQWFRDFTSALTCNIALLISHRFSTVRIADKIFVIGGGGIQEEGTHDKLLALDGWYARMFHTQANRYR